MSSPDLRTPTAELASNLVIRLDGSGAHAGLGGKGTWLDRLVAAGFVVPPTVVITTAAYEAVTAAATIEALIAELSTSAPDPSQPLAERERVDEAFLAVDLPAVARLALRVSFALVTSAEFPLVAVRSSATVEDMEGTSFAGQYQSFLGVDQDGFERAVRLVWASLWHPAPRAYRRFHGVGEAGIGMAVVVMRMADANRAGVAFTRDPGGSPEDVRVEVVDGLGEQLVSGAVTPTVHLVPRQPTTPPGDVPDFVREVAATAMAIERAFGQPQDIEWAETDETLYVLQARPITTAPSPEDGDGFDSETDNDTEWTTAGIAETLPGVIPPLVWQISQRAYEQALRQRFDRTGTLPSLLGGSHEFVGRLRGRAVLNLELLEDASGAARTAAGSEFDQQYFGSLEDPPGAVRRRGHLTLRARAQRWRVLLLGNRADQQASVEAETVITAAALLPSALDDLGGLQTLDRADLLMLRHRLLDLGERAVAAEVAVAAAAAAAYRHLELTLPRRFEADEAARWAQRLTTDGPAVIRTPDPASSRALMGGPTWNESPSREDPPGTTPSAAEPVGVHVETETVELAWGALVRRLRELPNWDITRVFTGQVVDVRLLVLRRHIEDATLLLQRRERAKRAVLQIGGQIRRVHLAIGHTLVSEGALDAATDVDYLSEDELEGTVPRPPPAVLARRRRWCEEQQATGSIPPRFRGRPPLPGVGVAVDGSVLHGWAAGPGIYRGRAVVLTDPIASTIDRGDVLVAKSTDASWGPVFMVAGAVILEEGGPLSHAAILARELGLPAVLNVPGVTERLRGNRSDVTVDGNTGRVVVHDAEQGSP